MRFTVPRYMTGGEIARLWLGNAVGVVFSSSCEDKLYLAAGSTFGRRITTQPSSDIRNSPSVTLNLELYHHRAEHASHNFDQNSPNAIVCPPCSIEKPSVMLFDGERDGYHGLLMFSMQNSTIFCSYMSSLRRTFHMASRLKRWFATCLKGLSWQCQSG